MANIILSILLLLISFVYGNLRIELKKKDSSLKDVIPLKYREDVIYSKIGDNPINAIIIHDLNEFIRINANVRVGMVNFKEMQYYGPLYIGSSKQKLNFVYDTGSSWLWFPKNGWVGWPTTNQFNSLNSSTYIQSQKFVELFYGKGHVNGTVVNDQVFIDDTVSNSINMKMLAIENAEDLEGTQADGILGLAPIPSSGADSFVKKLADGQVIDGASFTVYLGVLSESSYIEFGRYKGSTENVTWIPLISTAYWMVTFDSFIYKNTDLKLKSTRAVLDTGSSIIGFPTEDLKSLIFAIKEDRQLYYLEDINFYAMKCSSVYEFTDITVNIGGHLTLIPPKEYLLKLSDYCIFYIFDLGASVKFILLGDTYLRGNIIIHDIENKRIGMFDQVAHNSPTGATTSQTILKVFVGFIFLSALWIACLLAYMLLSKLWAPKPVQEHDYVELGA